MAWWGEGFRVPSVPQSRALQSSGIAHRCVPTAQMNLAQSRVSRPCE